MTIFASGSPVRCAQFPVRRRVASLPLFLVLLGHGLTPAAAANQPATAPSRVHPAAHETSRLRILVVSSFAAPEDIQPLERSIASQLADMNVDVIFHHVDALPPAVAKRDAWAIPLLDKYNATIAFVVHSSDARVDLGILQKTSNGTTITDRPVDVTQGAPRHEALAVIIRSTTAAIVDQKSHPSRVETVARKPSKTALPRSRTADDAGAAPLSRRPSPLFGEVGAAVGLMFSGTPPWFGMAVGLGGFPVRYLYLHVGYIVFSTVKKRAYDLALTIVRHPVYLGLGYARAFQRISWKLGVSLVLDYVTETVTSRDPKLDVEPNSRSFQLALLGYFQLEIRLKDPISLFLNMGAEIPIRSTQYDFDALEGDKTLLDPLPAQPACRLGLKIDFF